jgi:hypothetical protein
MAQQNVVESNSADPTFSGAAPGSTALDVGASEAAGAPPTQGAPEGAGTTNAGQPPQSAQPNGADTGAAPPQWEPDWREKMAGGDAKVAERLKRYTSPDKVVESLVQLQTRISAGELRSVLPKNATEEQRKTWRAENGIPDEPAGYDVTLADGVKMTAEDMPHLPGFLEAAHAANFTNAQVKAAVAWQKDWISGMEEDQKQKDIELTAAALANMKAAWGAEFSENMNRIHSIVGLAPQEIRDEVMRGRLPDGTPLGSSPAVMQWMADLARAADPSGTLTPVSGGDTLQTIGDRISQLEGIMRNERPKWNREPSLNQEYMKLLDAKRELESRRR